MASSQLSDARGSLFVGQLGVVDGLDDFIDQSWWHVDAAINLAVLQAQEELRSRASRLDGWKDIQAYLFVSFDGWGFSYYVDGPADVMDQANRLEFGDERTPPTAFLRRMAHDQSFLLGGQVAQVLSQEVPVA